MKTTQRGFIVPLLLIIAVILLAGGGAYFYTQNKSENPSVAGDVTLPQATSTALTTSQTTQVAPTGEIKPLSVTTFTTLDKIFPDALAFDIEGNLYMVGSGLYQITKPLTKISPSGVVTTVATVPAGIDALAFDKSNNLYGMNGSNNTIVKITPQGMITTFATVGSQPRVMGFDTAGNLYTANLNGDTFRESNNTNTISKVTPSGTVTNSPTVDFKNGIGRGSENTFSSVFALAFDASGNLYAALDDKRVIKVIPSGIATTFATLDSVPTSIAFDSSGNLYARGYSNISKITQSGIITTFTTAKPSMYNSSHLIVFDTFNNLYMADYSTSTSKTVISKINFAR